LEGIQGYLLLVGRNSRLFIISWKEFKVNYYLLEGIQGYLLLVGRNSRLFIISWKEFKVIYY
jgi:hypothetical protein